MKLYVVAGILLASPQACGASSALQVDVPTIHGPFSLTFSVALHHVPKQLSAYVPNVSTPGRVTVSSDGNKLLYIMQFASWRNIEIYDSSKSMNYEYNTAGRNAVVEPGLGVGYSRMGYLPFPAVSFEGFPLLQSVLCSQGAEGCTGTLAFLHATQSPASLPATNNNSPVKIGRWNGLPVILTCAVYQQPEQQLHFQGGVVQGWAFKRFMMFKSIPISQIIDYTENGFRRYGPVIQYEYHGNLLHNRAATLVPNCDMTYTLNQASEQALPPDNYKLESYLTAKNDVDDYETTNTSVNFTFDPKGGSLNQQRDTALRIAAQQKSDKERGTGPDRTRTGMFALLAILCGTTGWLTWRKIRPRA